MILPGDFEKAPQWNYLRNELVSDTSLSDPIFTANIFKFSHHGSGEAMPPNPMLQTEYAFVSGFSQHYGHPRCEVITEYKNNWNTNQITDSNIYNDRQDMCWTGGQDWNHLDLTTYKTNKNKYYWRGTITYNRETGDPDYPNFLTIKDKVDCRVIEIIFKNSENSDIVVNENKVDCLLRNSYYYDTCINGPFAGVIPYISLDHDNEYKSGFHNLKEAHDTCKTYVTYNEYCGAITKDPMTGTYRLWKINFDNQNTAMLRLPKEDETEDFYSSSRWLTWIMNRPQRPPTPAPTPPPVSGPVQATRAKRERDSVQPISRLRRRELTSRIKSNTNISHGHSFTSENHESEQLAQSQQLQPHGRHLLQSQWIINNDVECITQVSSQSSSCDLCSSWIGCPSGYTLTGCSGLSYWRSVYTIGIDESSQQCAVSNKGGNGVWAYARCCKNLHITQHARLIATPEWGWLTRCDINNGYKLIDCSTRRGEKGSKVEYTSGQNWCYNTGDDAESYDI